MVSDAAAFELENAEIDSLREEEAVKLAEKMRRHSRGCVRVLSGVEEPGMPHAAAAPLHLAFDCSPCTASLG